MIEISAWNLSVNISIFYFLSELSLCILSTFLYEKNAAIFYSKYFNNIPSRKPDQDENTCQEVDIVAPVLYSRKKWRNDTFFLQKYIPLYFSWKGSKLLRDRDRRRQTETQGNEDCVQKFLTINFPVGNVKNTLFSCRAVRPFLKWHMYFYTKGLLMVQLRNRTKTKDQFQNVLE